MSPLLLGLLLFFSIQTLTGFFSSQPIDSPLLCLWGASWGSLSFWSNEQKILPFALRLVFRQCNDRQNIPPPEPARTHPDLSSAKSRDQSSPESSLPCRHRLADLWQMLNSVAIPSILRLHLNILQAGEQSSSS